MTTLIFTGHLIIVILQLVKVPVLLLNFFFFYQPDNRSDHYKNIAVWLKFNTHVQLYFNGLLNMCSFKGEVPTSNNYPSQTHAPTLQKRCTSNFQHGHQHNIFVSKTT